MFARAHSKCRKPTAQKQGSGFHGRIRSRKDPCNGQLTTALPFVTFPPASCAFPLRWCDSALGGPIMETLAYDLATPYQLRPNNAHSRDGHILLRGVASQEEIDHVHPLITGLLAAHARTRTVWVAPDESAPLLEYASNLWQKSEELKAFIFAGRFARIAAELMGVRGVRLYHDEALVKEPGSSVTPWHKDHYTGRLRRTHHQNGRLSDSRVEMAPLRRHASWTVPGSMSVLRSRRALQNIRAPHACGGGP
jgi:hypothetical protein